MISFIYSPPVGHERQRRVATLLNVILTFELCFGSSHRTNNTGIDTAYGPSAKLQIDQWFGVSSLALFSRTGRSQLACVKSSLFLGRSSFFKHEEKLDRYRTGSELPTI